jgi:PAS domain S-box-containing protein
MTATLDNAVADLQRDNAELQRQLDACRAELTMRNSEFSERIEHQSATIDVLKAMSASPGDPQPVFDLIVRRARDMCNATTAGLFEFDGELVHRRSWVGTETYSTPEAIQAYQRLFPMVPTRGSISCRAILDRQTIHVRDMATEPGVGAALRNLGYNSQISVPLLRDGAAIGAVALTSLKTGGFSDSQIALLQTFAEQAVIAITSVETYRELQQRTGDLQEALGYQTATSNVLQVISRSTFDLQPILDTLVESGQRLCDSDNATLAMREGGVLRCVATRSHDPAYDAFLRSRTFAPSRERVGGRVALTGEVVHIPDVTTDPDYRHPEAVMLGKIRTALGVPLLRDGSVVGTLTLNRNRVAPFSERQIELVRTFADQAVIAIENARLLTELRESLEQQTATAEVLQVINSSPGDLAPVFDAMLEKAMQSCDAAFGLMQTYDGRLVRTVATRGVTAEYAAHLAVPRPITPGTNHDRLVRGEPFVHIEDVRDTELYHSGQPQRRASADLGGQRTLVCVALRKADDCLGFFFIFRQEVRPFSDKQIALLQTFAAQAVIAMENARLLGELQTRTAELAERNTAFAERIDHQAATIDVLKQMSASPADAQPVFDLICHQARALLGTLTVGLFEYDGRLVHHRATSRSASFDPTTIAAYEAGWPRVPDRGSLSCRAILDGTIIHVRDMDAEPGVSPEIRAVGNKSQISIPLLRDGRAIGAISTASRRVDGISDTQIELLETFAEQAVIAIQSAETWRELQARTRDLEESLEYQTATSDVLNVISRSTADVQPVLDTVTETAVRLCGADTGAITVREGEVYRYVAGNQAATADAEYWAALRQRTIVPGRDSMAARVALEGRVVHVADILADPDYAFPGNAATGRRTMLGVPLLRDGAVLGTIGLSRKRVEPFTERQIELVRTFADQAVIAIENARLLGELQQRTDELAARNSEFGERIEQQSATIDVLKAMSASPGDPQPVFDLIVRRARDLCNTEAGALFEFDGELVHRRSSVGQEAFATPDALEAYKRLFPMVPTRGSITCRAILDRQTIHVRDIATVSGVSATVRNLGHKSQISVPLLRDGAAIGAISQNGKEPGGFTDSQVALLQTFAEQAVIAITTAETYRALQARTRDLEESLEYQTATSDVLNVISRSTADVQPVLDTVVETAARLCGADTGNIAIREGEVYRHVASSFSASDPEFWAIQRQRTIVPGRGSVAGRVALEGRAVHIEDISADPDYGHPETIRAGLRTALGVPLLREGAVLGSINLSRKRVEPYTERQVELVRTFADQTVIAMENARLLGELQARTRDLEESLEYQTATSDVLNVISRSTADVQPVLDTVVETAVRLCGADLASIAMREGEVYRWVANDGVEPEHWAVFRQRTIVPGRQNIASRVALEGRVVHVADIRADPDYAQPETVARGNRTMLGVPLLREGAVLGTINLARKRVELFTERQIELVRTFADQAVIAIENARLLTELRESLEQQTATAEVLQVINSSPGELQPVFEAILEKAHTHCGATGGTLYLFDGETLWGVAMHGYSPDWAEQARRGINFRESSLAAPLLAGARISHTPDLRLIDDPIARASAERGGFRTMLLLPLRKDGALLGVITCGRGEVRPFSEKEIAFLENFAVQAVIAMDNARLLEEIRRRQAELRVTFDNMGDGVAMFDAELRLAAWNRNFQQMLDLPDALLAERPNLADYIRHLATHGEYGEVDVEVEVRRLLEAAGTQYSTERTRPDGRVIEVRANPVPGGGVVINYSDVTERKRAEAEIRAARDTAEKALGDLQAAQASLVQAEKMASLGQLTAGIAHEIKNPLNFVNNFAGLSVELLDELRETAAPAVASLGEDTRAEIDEIVQMLTGNLAKIAEHGRRADGIVKSMLEHSRGASGERREVDLNGLVEEALNLAYHGARAQDSSFNITLEREFAPGLAPIELAPQEMTRVLLNLFGNGFYAAAKRQRNSVESDFRPTLKVTTRDLGEAVEIHVRDNGTGIPPEIKDKLFQPFFTTKPTGEGTGLGLSISWDIVTQQHGGTIAVDSREGEFTEFTIRLPRVRG